LREHGSDDLAVGTAMTTTDANRQIKQGNVMKTGEKSESYGWKRRTPEKKENDQK
jgi:hypothetical protein